MRFDMDKDNKKIKLLICGIVMNSAGTEKSFLSFASQLDYEKFDVTLLLAKKEGALYEMIPKQINVIEMPAYGEMFTLNGSNAAKTIFNCFVKKNPFVLFEIFPYFVKMKLSPSRHGEYAMKLWLKMMKKIPRLDGEYDVAAAYWGDKTMFYMVDKVNAAKKIAWLHFDYANPPRDDATYLPYFKQCDKIVTVSSTVDNALKKKLPEIADKCVMMENITDPKLIWDMALQGESFKDHTYTGKRLLSVMRICEQKGFDFIVPVLKRLRDNGYFVRWYILGTGERSDIDTLIEAAMSEGVADMLILLGTTTNPYPYLRDCDIYIQPARYEGKPISVEEAKIMYKPIIACNYLSASEQLDRGRFGMICEIGVDGLYESIVKMLNDESIGDNYSQELAHAKFENKDEINKFYDMIK